jgi:cytidylate kinase
MKEAYELVKGMYPIDIQDRWIYDLIINNLKSYKKEKSKSLKKGI